MTWVVWAVLSAVFAAATAILAKIGVTGIDSNLATAIRTSVVLVFTWLLVLMNRSAIVSNISTRSWTFLSLSALATGLSWLCYFRALQLGPASKVAPVDKLSLVLVIAAAAIFLGEPVSFATGLGAALVLAGVLVLAMA